MIWSSQPIKKKKKDLYQYISLFFIKTIKKQPTSKQTIKSADKGICFSNKMHDLHYLLYQGGRWIGLCITQDHYHC